MLITRVPPDEAPALPVTLAEARAFLRVDATDEDVFIARLIKAANDLVADLGWMTLATTKWQLVLPGFPSRIIRLPRGPVRTVHSIGYVQTSGQDASLESGDFQVSLTDSESRVAPLAGQSWPAVQCEALEPVTITFTAGFDGSTPGQEFPEQAKQAVLMVIAHWYENREAALVGTISKEMEFGVRALCQNIGFWCFNPGG